jgi:hypothetical protein
MAKGIRLLLFFPSEQATDTIRDVHVRAYRNRLILFYYFQKFGR